MKVHLELGLWVLVVAPRETTITTGGDSGPSWHIGQTRTHVFFTGERKTKPHRTGVVVGLGYTTAAHQIHSTSYLEAPSETNAPFAWRLTSVLPQHQSVRQVRCKPRLLRLSGNHGLHQCRRVLRLGRDIGLGFDAFSIGLMGTSGRLPRKIHREQRRKNQHQHRTEKEGSGETTHR